MGRVKEGRKGGVERMRGWVPSGRRAAGWGGAMVVIVVVPASLQKVA